MRLDKKDMAEHIKDTMIDVMQMKFVETDEPTVEVLMPVEKFNSQTMGVLHGGATIALAETAAGLGSNLSTPEDVECYGLQISASHISSAKIGDTVRAIATPLHLGRTTHVWDVTVTSVNTGRLISTVRVTNFAKVKKPQ
ncbi:MAG: hypothetical protein RL662_2486 [Bacteroidota bacterium]|jgi:uncharacterized protein (TIGR00369 family)